MQGVTIRLVGSPDVLSLWVSCIVIAPNGFPQLHLRLHEVFQWLTAKQPASNQGRLSLNYFKFAFHFAASFNC